LIGISFAFAICQAAYPLLILSAVTYVTKWYVKRRGWALGVATIALPLTSSFYLPLGNSVIAADGKTIFYLVVFVVIIAMAIFNVIVIRENPENRNVSPDGIPLSEDEKARIQETSQKTGILTFKFILSRKEGWLLIAANTMLRFGMVCLMSVLILRMTDIGLERAAAANIMAIATIIGIPFSYFWGLLDDKIGTNKACTLFGITYVIGFFLVLIMNVDNKYLIFFVAAYVASTSGGQQNLMQSIVSFVFGRKYFIQANRFVSLFADTGSAFAFTFMMTMYAKFQSYNQAYIVLIIISLVMTVLYSQIKKTFDAERIELIDKKAPKTE
jgi:Na+/melibiose symporter-like transporter